MWDSPGLSVSVPLQFNKFDSTTMMAPPCHSGCCVLLLLLCVSFLHLLLTPMSEYTIHFSHSVCKHLLVKFEVRNLCEYDLMNITIIIVGIPSVQGSCTHALVNSTILYAYTIYMYRILNADPIV